MTEKLSQYHKKEFGAPQNQNEMFKRVQCIKNMTDAQTIELAQTIQNIHNYQLRMQSFDVNERNKWVEISNRS